MPTVNRLSVDLDFNAVGTKPQVLAERQQIAQSVMSLLSHQDTGYELTHDYRYEQSTIQATYIPLSGGARQRLKIEISYIERVAILGREDRPLAIPGMEKPVPISTYRLEELSSTKLRALYARRKGRDVYDLFHIGAFLNEQALRKMTLYYFYHGKMIFHYPSFRANVEEKMRQRGFADDVRGLIRLGQGFDWQQACQTVLERFSFLENLDDRDHLFLDLARYLLGKSVSDRSREAIQQIEYPLAWLMEGIPLSPETAALRQEDIRVYAP